MKSIEFPRDSCSLLMEDKSPGTSHITVLDVSREPLTSITATWSLVAGYLLFVCKAVLIKWESHVRSMHWMIRITEMHFYWRVMKNSTAISNLCQAFSSSWWTNRTAVVISLVWLSRPNIIPIYPCLFPIVWSVSIWSWTKGFESVGAIGWWRREREASTFPRSRSKAFL